MLLSWQMENFVSHIRPLSEELSLASQCGANRAKIVENVTDLNLSAFIFSNSLGILSFHLKMQTTALSEMIFWLIPVSFGVVRECWRNKLNFQHPSLCLSKTPIPLDHSESIIWGAQPLRAWGKDCMQDLGFFPTKILSASLGMAVKSQANATHF